MELSTLIFSIIGFLFTVFLAIIGYFLKNLNSNIDHRFNEIDNQLRLNSKLMHELELKIAERYVTKEEYQNQGKILDKVIDTFCEKHRSIN